MNDDIDGVVAEGFDYGWTNERSGEVLITGSGPWFVSFNETWFEGNATYEGAANYLVVDDAGTLRIANHYWSGLVTWGDPFE